MSIEDLIHLRRLFSSYCIHERIVLLHRIASKDKDWERWEKYIPHEMKDFDEYFDGYSASKMMYIYISSKQEGFSFRPNVFEGGYFTFNAKQNRLTIVRDIEARLRDVFDKLLEAVEPEIIKIILESRRRTTSGCTYSFSKEEFLEISNAVASPNSEAASNVEINLLKIQAPSGKENILCEVFETLEGGAKRLIYNS